MVRVLFTSSGRRVSLLRFFRESALRYELPIEIHAGDILATAPTWQVADRTHLLPRCGSPEYVSRVLEICTEYAIDLLIPLIDPELSVLASAANRFHDAGVDLVVSDLATIEIAADKLRTHEHCQKADIASARTWDVASGDVPQDARFPLVVKPRRGSAAAGVSVVRDREEFAFCVQQLVNPCAQELLEGCEYTMDVLVDSKGSPLCIVPRERWETRAGEISKGVTLLDDELIRATTRLIRSLPGVRGPVNCQAFRTEPGAPIRFNDINTRFGGGYVLSYRAGADFPAALLLARLGREIPADDVFRPRSGVVLLRYDDELVTDLDALERLGFDRSNRFPGGLVR